MKKQSFLYGSAILILSAVITKIIGALFRIPLANFLGGTGMGYFSCAYGLFMPIYAISVTGLPAAVAKLTAENSALKKYSDIRKIKHVSLVIFSLTGLGSSIIIVLAAYPFCKYIAGDINAYPAVVAIAPSVFFGCIMSVYRGYYEGLRNMFPTAVSQVIEGLIKLAVGLGLAFYALKTAYEKPELFLDIIRRKDITAEQAALPYAAAAAVLGITISTVAGTLFLILRDKISGDGISYAQLKQNPAVNSFGRTAKNLLRIVIPISIGALVTNLTSLIDLATIIRSLKIAVINSPEKFARYITPELTYEMLPNFIFGSFTGLAVSVFHLIPSFTNMFGKSVLPAISEAFAENNKSHISDAIYNVIFTTGFIAVPSGIGISVLSEQILYLLFPSKTAEISVCYSSLAILGVGVIFLSLSMSLFAVFQAAGKAEIPVIIMLAGVIVKLAGNTFLVPIAGLNVSGAAISTLLCYIIIFILSITVVANTAEINIKQIALLLFKISFSALLCGLGAYLSNNILSRYFSSSLVLLVSIAVGGCIYILSTHLLGILTKSTLKMLIS